MNETKNSNCVICGNENGFYGKANYKEGIVIEPLCAYHKQIDEQIRRAM